MARARTERTAWIEAGLAALAEGGPDAVRVEALAGALGVTKGGFYGYYANRDELLTAMLDTWERESTVDVLEGLEREGVGPREAAVEAAARTWSTERLLPIDLAVRSWARRDAGVAERLRRVDTFRLEYLRRKMRALCPDPEEADARSVLAYTAMIGSHYAFADLSNLAGARKRAIELITRPGSLGR